jgi:hypothetical protein
MDEMVGRGQRGLPDYAPLDLVCSCATEAIQLSCSSEGCVKAVQGGVEVRRRRRRWGEERKERGIQSWRHQARVALRGGRLGAERYGARVDSENMKGLFAK